MAYDTTQRNFTPAYRPGALDLVLANPPEGWDEGDWCAYCDSPLGEDDCEHEPPPDADEIATRRWERSRDE